MLGIVFAGQGSQIVGMGMDFYHHYSEAKDVFDEADSILGWSVSEFCNETDTTRLAHTRKVQAAILTMEIALLRTLQSRCNLPIAFSAGHSLGEYSALVAAGAIGFSDALRLVELRAEIMNKACQKNQGMLAISGISEKQIYSLLQLGEESLFADIACLNGPEQLVLSGDIAVLAYCKEKLELYGARTKILNVSGAFHSRYMQPYACELQDYLINIPWNSLSFPVISNVTGKPYPSDSKTWSDLLMRQIYEPVRWMQSTRCMYMNGVTTILEIAPTPTVGQLIKETIPAFNIFSLCTSADLPNAERLIMEIVPQSITVSFIGRCLSHAVATPCLTQISPDFDEKCCLPYQSTLQRYQVLREQPQEATTEDAIQAYEMFKSVLSFKGVELSEFEARRDELMWLDRHQVIGINSLITN